MTVYQGKLYGELQRRNRYLKYIEVIKDIYSNKGEQ